MDPPSNLDADLLMYEDDSRSAISIQEEARLDALLERIPDQSIPSADEARLDALIHEVTESNRYSGRRRRRRMCAIGLISLLAVGAILGFGIAIIKENNKSTTTSAAVQGEDRSPTQQGESSSPPPPAAEDNSATASARLDELKAYLVDQGISEQGSLEDEQSPQFRAAYWLAEQDSLQLSMNPVSDKATQRYVAALMYFSLHGAEWNENLNFLSKKSECEWNFGALETAEEGRSLKYGLGCNDEGEITTIFISANGLKGRLPEELSLLTSLEHLSLFRNGIGGTIPSSYKSLTNLKFVAVESNFLTGIVPEWVSEWSSLEFLALGDNLLTGAIPSFEGMESLKELVLDQNALTGDIAILENVKSLRTVLLNDNKLDGRVHSSSFLNFPDLITLDLGNNELTGYFPEHFYTIESVTLHNNNLKGELPDVQIEEFPIEYLSLHHNVFTGDVPKSLNKLKQLYHLDLSFNALDGDIGTYDGLVQLETLYLMHNPFVEGRIPDLRESLKLERLSLQKSNRMGSIPAWMGLLDSLRMLDLQRNRLTGDIPSSLGRLEELSILMLSRNGLNGEFPPEIGDLENLALVFLDKNRLEGSVGSLCKGEEFGSRLFTLSADCEEIECECCDVCCKTGDGGCNIGQFLVAPDDYKRGEVVVFTENLVYQFGLKNATLDD